MSNFTILHFLSRTTAYTIRAGTPADAWQIASVYKGSLEYGSRSSTLPRTIAYAAEQLHQQDVWQIASAYGGRYGLGDKGDSSYLAKGWCYLDCTRLSLKAIGIPAYDRQCSGAALPRRRPEGDSIAIRKLSGRSQGGSYAIRLANTL